MAAPELSRAERAARFALPYCPPYTVELPPMGRWLSKWGGITCHAGSAERFADREGALAALDALPAADRRAAWIWGPGGIECNPQPTAMA